MDEKILKAAELLNKNYKYKDIEKEGINRYYISKARKLMDEGKIVFNAEGKALYADREYNVSKEVEEEKPVDVDLEVQTGEGVEHDLAGIVKKYIDKYGMDGLNVLKRDLPRVLSRYGLTTPTGGGDEGGVAKSLVEPKKETSEEGEGFKDLEKIVEEYAKRRQKVKETLEKMGFKVEDQYISRDEVEKIIEEERRKAFDEAVEDKRVEAVERIVKDVASQIIQLFGPAIQYIFGGKEVEESGEGGEANE